MTATIDQIRELRRMVGEVSTDSTYSDPDLKAFIERYPLLDEQGEVPYTLDVSTTPPGTEVNEDWIPTYDLNAAAEAIWLEKCAAIASMAYDFKADGGSYSLSQKMDAYQLLASKYGARKSAGTIQLHMSPDPNDSSSYIGNLPEDDYDIFSR
ncbi:MAG: hypothetical protein V3S69_06995 [Dehalococcoidales bacterium]